MAATEKTTGGCFRPDLWHGAAASLDIAGHWTKTSRMRGTPPPACRRHPAEGSTLPVAEKDGAYSWCKAPRLAGQVVETGALARQVVRGIRWRAT